MSKALKYTFLIHAAVSALLGAPLLLAPGRFLHWFHWAPVDPIISRLLGSALLALAWSSVRGWKATERVQVAVILEVEAAFTALCCVGLLRHLLKARYPWTVWTVFAVCAFFAAAWIAALLRK